MLKTLELWTFTGQIVWCVNLLVFGSTHSKWKLLGRFLGVKLHGISACAAAGAATLDPQPAAPRGNFRWFHHCPYRPMRSAESTHTGDREGRGRPRRGAEARRPGRSAHAAALTLGPVGPPFSELEQAPSQPLLWTCPQWTMPIALRWE